MRILVVEDDFLIALDLEFMLEGLGQTVIGPVARVHEALALIESETPDAALLDINLGAETSFAAARALARSGTPFAFVTAHQHAPLPADLAETLRLGKPLNSAALAPVIERFRNAP